MGHILGTIPQIASQLGIADEGFRLAVNTKENGGQTVRHLHWHMMGGRKMTWPPG
jgi:histidine triad (HIT) family protein